MFVRSTLSGCHCVHYSLSADIDLGTPKNPIFVCESYYFDPFVRLAQSMVSSNILNPINQSRCLWLFLRVEIHPFDWFLFFFQRSPSVSLPND